MEISKSSMMMYLSKMQIRLRKVTYSQTQIGGGGRHGVHRHVVVQEEDLVEEVTLEVGKAANKWAMKRRQKNHPGKNRHCHLQPVEGVNEGRKIVGQADTADDEPIRYEVAGCTFESVFFNFVLENDLYFKKYFPKKDLGIHMMKVHHLQSFKLPYQEFY